MLTASGFAINQRSIERMAQRAGVTLPEVGTTAAAPTSTPTSTVGVEHTGEAPRSNQPIIEILWTSSDYTGGATPGVNYPPAYQGTPPPFGKKAKHVVGYIPYTGPYVENPQGTYVTTTTWPEGQLELMESNRQWAKAVVDRFVNSEVNWIVGSYPGRLMEQVKNVRVSGRKLTPREVLIEYLAAIFTFESTSIPAFLRLALQGAQPLDKDTAEAEIAASLAAKTPTESLAQYVTRFNQHARDWLVARDALSWPAVVEIILSLPLVKRSETFEIESLKWVGGLTGRHTLRRHNWNTPADYEPTSIPQLNQVSEMLKWYAWSHWKTGLLDSNRIAGYAFAKTLPDDKFEAMVGEFGLKPELTKQEKQVGLAEAWGSMATELNQSFMVTIARDPTSDDRTLEQIAAAVSASGRRPGRPGRRRLNLRGRRARGSGKSFFEKLADGFKKLVTHPKKWFNSLQEEVGKLLVTIGKEVRRWGRVPIIGDLFLASTAFDFVFGTVFQELGKALQDHSVSAISLVNLADGVARIFDAAGKVTVMVAPFLPPPFNLLAAAIGAISIAAGKGVYMLVHQSDVNKQIDEYNEQKKLAFELEVAAAQKAAEEEAAREQSLIDQAAAEAHSTWWKWAEENGLLGTMVANASKPKPLTVEDETRARRRRRIAVAAAVTVPLVSLAVAVMASTRT